MLVAVGRAAIDGGRGSVRDTGKARGTASAVTAAATAPERPRPKEPEVLVTTAITGEGIPELMASLNRHRARGREASDTPARLARAEAQVWAILAARLRAEMHDDEHRAFTESVIRRGATHDIDPFSAADQPLPTSRP